MNSKALLAGLGGKQITYNGDFKLLRHESDKGTVITFTDWLGKKRSMLVLDAAYRDVIYFAALGANPGGLENFTGANKLGGMYMGSKAITSNEPMPANITNEFIYSHWAETFANDKTVRENCDIWEPYLTDKLSVGSCFYRGLFCARDQIINGKPCDVPNIYETMIIWACGDILDELDPTAETNSTMKLGYTSTGYNGKGRQFTGKKHSCNESASYVSDSIYSSTHYDSNNMRGVYYNGYVGGVCKGNLGSCGAIVPILELD